MTELFDSKGFFNKLIGSWAGEVKTYFKENELADKSAVKGTIKLVLEGLFLIHEYEGILLGEKMIGLAIYGYNQRKNQFEMAWINNKHQGSEIMYSVSKNTDNKFSVLGHYSTNDESEIWGWKTTLDLKSGDNLIISHFNISPQQHEYLGVEFNYKRKE